MLERMSEQFTVAFWIKVSNVVADIDIVDIQVPQLGKKLFRISLTTALLFVFKVNKDVDTVISLGNCDIALATWTQYTFALWR